MTDGLPKGRTEQLPPLQNVEKTLALIADREPVVHAFVEHRPDQVRAEAKSVSRTTPLATTCVAVKEIIDVAGYRCGWGTPIHRDRVATADAEVVRRIKAAGGVVAGITVSTEYALARPGPTVNPRDSSRSPGGSSSGSAAAVGAGMVQVGLGSQTIGSIIRPAAYCGVVGVKPSWGMVDCTGVMPLSETLDHVGIVADRVGRARTILSVLTGLQATAHWDLSGLRVLRLAPWYSETLSAGMTTALAKAAEWLRGKGITVDDAFVPEEIAQNEEKVASTLLCHDLVRYHGADFSRAGDQMSEPLRRLMGQGVKISHGDYHAALSRQAEIADRLDAILGRDTVFLAPATLGIAPAQRCGTGSRAPQRLWSLGGQPAVTVPYGNEQGLPLGVQVIAARGCDELALTVAELLEEPLGPTR